MTPALRLIHDADRQPRSIPVVVPVDVQLPLALLWAEPFDREQHEPGPEPVKAVMRVAA